MYMFQNMAGFILSLGCRGNLVHSQIHVQSPRTASGLQKMATKTKDIQELCDEYYIETRHIEKLNELMKDRQEPHELDLMHLWIKK